MNKEDETDETCITYTKKFTLLAGAAEGVQSSTPLTMHCWQPGLAT